MKQLFAKIFLTLALLLTTLQSWAAKAEFEVSTPLAVAMGEAFRVEFSLSAKPDDDSFQAPAFEGFDVLAGPVVSHGTSMSIINGSMTRSVSYTYTFVLLAQSAGNKTIGAATIKVDGESYRTRPQPIEVVDEGASAAAAHQGSTAQRRDRREQMQSNASDRVAEDDILLRAVVSKATVYKNEPLHVTYKLYTRVPFGDYSFDASPSFNGFWAQDLVKKGSQAQSGRET